MFYLLFVQLVTTFLVSYLSQNLKPDNPYHIKEYGRLSFFRPPPPPQLFFPSSADYADEYYLRSLSNVTISMSSTCWNQANSPGNQTNTESSFVRVSPLARLCSDILQSMVQIASWFVEIAAELIVAAVQMFPIVGPVAAAAHVLREERSRDLLGLVKRSWKLASVINYQSGIITDLRAKLIKSEKELESQRSSEVRYSALDVQVDLLQKDVVKLESLQKTSDDRIEMLTREGEDNQREHTALLQTIQDLREREKASGDVIQQLELTIEGQAKQIKRREGGRLRQQDDSAKLAKAEDRFRQAHDKDKKRIAELEETLEAERKLGWEATVELEESLEAERQWCQEATERLEESLVAEWESGRKATQTLEDKKRITELEEMLEAERKLGWEATVELEESLEAERQWCQEATERLEESLVAERESGRKATQTLEGELQKAREYVEGLMSTIRGNSQELQMYRDRARAQRLARDQRQGRARRQAGPSA